MPAKAKIDRAKLRAAIRKLGDEYVYYLLDEALDLLPGRVRRILHRLHMARASRLGPR